MTDYRQQIRERVLECIVSRASDRDCYTAATDAIMAQVVEPLVASVERMAEFRNRLFCTPLSPNEASALNLSHHASLALRLAAGQAPAAVEGDGNEQGPSAPPRWRCEKCGREWKYGCMFKVHQRPWDLADCPGPVVQVTP